MCTYERERESSSSRSRDEEERTRREKKEKVVGVVEQRRGVAFHASSFFLALSNGHILLPSKSSSSLSLLTSLYLFDDGCPPNNPSLKLVLRTLLSTRKDRCLWTSLPTRSSLLLLLLQQLNHLSHPPLFLLHPQNHLRTFFLLARYLNLNLTMGGDTTCSFKR